MGWGGSIDGVRVTGREGEVGTLDSRHGFEEILDDRGDGRVALGCPNPRAAVDIVRDGYCDIAHGSSGGCSPFYSTCQCAPLEGNYPQRVKVKACVFPGLRGEIWGTRHPALLLLRKKKRKDAYLAIELR